MRARFTVAIVGRPNVGKSTLFNRLVGKGLALVDSAPGVTRDRREAEGRIGDLAFRVIDTAGLEEADELSLEARMRSQTERALDAADLALLLIDARAGITELDRHFGVWLRKRAVPVVVLANKCEGRGGDAGAYEAFGLGLGDPIPISAAHGEGMADIYDALSAHVVAHADEAEGAQVADAPLQLAIVGRPNVGKSTLVNRLIGDERVVTGPEVGITRDAISVDWSWAGHPVRLVDTAGLRRKARVTAKLETMAVEDSLRAIRLAQVVVLVIDATVMMERQDLSIGSHVIEEGRALVVAVNKWDLITGRNAALRQLRDRMETSFPQARGVPVVTLSALSGRGAGKLLPAVLRIYEVWNQRLGTGVLNRWLNERLEAHPPPVVAGRRLRLRYITQAKSRPPTFVLFANRPQDLPVSYERYLINGLRDDFALIGVPIRLILRKGWNPYAKKES